MKIRIFISSVQKELEVERVSIAGAVSGNRDLSQICEIVLYDKEPLSGRRIAKPYLKCLDSCDIYILMVDREYGRIIESISATHEEYRHAMKQGMPMMIFVRGHHDSDRKENTQEFFEEIKAAGHTYRRFHDRVDLLPEVKKGLVRILEESFKMKIELELAGKNSKAARASTFEQQILDVRDSGLALDVALEWLRSIKNLNEEEKPAKSVLLNILREKGLIRKEEKGAAYKAMASGLLFLGKNPSEVFPQCRILVDAYDGREPDRSRHYFPQYYFLPESISGKKE